MLSLLKRTAASPQSDFYSIFKDGGNFAKNAEKQGLEYRSNAPFAHIVIDDFFNPRDLRALLPEIPSPLTSKELFTSDVKHLQEYKFAWREVPRLGPQSLRIIHYLSVKPFLEYLTKLTGIEGLMPDPYLWGGGFHQIIRGGKLAIHADFNIHPQTKLYRRINVLVYLNEGWNEAWGGNLELWSEDMQRCEQKIAPHFNRMAIFNTTENSYHGHPDALDCPPDVVRKSLALYYYTYDRPLEKAHSTLWQKRPEDAQAVAVAAEEHLKRNS